MSRTLRAAFGLFLLLIGASALVGCGGGSSGASTPAAPTAQTLSGTAATGLPMDGYVYVIDVNGTEVNAAIGTGGVYTVEVTGMTGPFMVRAVPSAGATQYAWANAANTTVNVTPFSTLALFLAVGQEDLGALYTNWAASHAALVADAVHEAQARINANFAGELTTAGLDPNTYDFLSTDFTANSTGFDAVLDSVQVAIVGGNVWTFEVQVNGLAYAFNGSIDITGFDIGGTAGGGSTGGGSTGGGSTGTIAGTWKMTVSGTANGVAINQMVVNNIPALDVPANQTAFGQSAEAIAGSLTSNFSGPGVNLTVTVSNLVLTYNANVTGAVGDTIVGTYKATVSVSGTANGITIPPTTVPVDLTYTYERIG